MTAKVVNTIGRRRSCVSLVLPAEINSRGVSDKFEP